MIQEENFKKTDMDDLLFCKACGNSMYPIIKDGTYLTINKKSSKKIVGDIVLFYGSDNKMYVHRIVKLFFCGGNAFAITKGDNSIYPDAPINISQIIGTVVNIK